MKHPVAILTCLALFFTFVTVERYMTYRAELEAVNEAIKEVDMAMNDAAEAFGSLGSVLGSPPMTKYKADNRIKPGFPPVCIYSSLFSLICGTWAVVIVVKAKKEQESLQKAVAAEKTAVAIDTYFK